MANKHGRSASENKSGRAGIKKQRREMKELRDEFWVDMRVEKGRGQRWVNKLNNPSQKFVTRLINSNKYREMVKRRVGALSNQMLNKKLDMLIKNGNSIMNSYTQWGAKIYSNISKN